MGGLGYQPDRYQPSSAAVAAHGNSKPSGCIGWQAFTDSELQCPHAAAGYATTSSVDLCEYGYWAGAVSVCVSVILLMLQVCLALVAHAALLSTALASHPPACL
jgi:hypothetical protein